MKTIYRVGFPLSWRLGEWRLADSALGDSWCLDDPWWWSLWLRSSLCRQWWSAPLVPDGPLDQKDRSTTYTLDDTVLLDFLWDRLDELPFLPSRPSARSTRHPFSWRVGPEVRPQCVQFNGVVHGIVRPLGGPRCLALLLLFDSFVRRRPHFRKPIFTNATWRFSNTQRHPVVETTFLTAMMVVTATSKVRASWELELRFLRRQTVTWFRHLAYLTGSERLLTKVGIKDVLDQNQRGKAHNPATDWRGR